MSHFRKSGWLALALVLLVLTQACSPASTAVPATTVTATEPAPLPATQPPVETAPPMDIPENDPTSLCPVPEGDDSLYVDRENGFCLLYPADFSPGEYEQRPDEVLMLLGPRESDKPKTQEEIGVVVTVEYNGPADGLDATGYARKWHEFYGEGAPSDAPYEEQAGSLGGQPAVILSDLPGFVSQRSTFAVANGIKYRITLSPQPEDHAELAEAASRGWEKVTSSVVFFPPENTREVKRADEVCPQETSDLRLYRSDQDGFCFLYPADFATDPNWPGMVKGGPVITEWPGIGEVQAYVSVGAFGHFEGQTPRQVLEPRMQQIDAASVQDATIGGYPAVIYRSLQGPWPSRQAMIVVDGDVYTIVNEPWDPEQFPDGMPYLDRVWEAVTGSLAFYEPWR